MPQEIRIVQCFECKIYQVDLVKKTKKWTYKVCNAKQSLRGELFRGSGPACRTRVQELNKQRELNALNEEKLVLEVTANIDCGVANALEQCIPQSTSGGRTGNCISKWSNFVDKELKHTEALGENKEKSWPNTGSDDNISTAKKLCKWDSYV